MTPAANYYQTHTPGKSHASAHHTDQSAKQERLPAYIPAQPKPYAFDIGQVVTVTKSGLHKGMTGTVTSRRIGVPHRYSVEIPMPGVLTPVYPFTETELTAMVALPTGKPTKPPRVKRDDCISVFCRTMHTWDDMARRLLVRERAYAARQRAKILALDAIIYLPAQSNEKATPRHFAAAHAPMTIKHENETVARYLRNTMKVQRRKVKKAA